MSKDAKNVPALRFRGYSDAWEKRKLGEVADIVGGGTPSTSRPEYWNGEIDWYAPAEIGTQRYVYKSRRQITELGLEKSSAVMLPANKTILFTSRAGIGNAAILTSPATTNQGFQSMIVNSNTDTYFLYSKIPDIKHKAIRVAAGSTFLEISGKSLSKIPIKLPIFEEQVKIGRLFLKIDNLIAATQRRIDALEQAKKALLQRLFDQSWRFKGYSDPWEKRKLGETNSYFTDGNYGESYPKESELSDKENGVPFLRGSNLRNGELIEDNANYITKEKHAELTSGHLVEDDIVLAVRGSLGALGYVKDENIDWNINSQLAVIRTDKSELSGKFLVQFLLSWRGQKELLSRNTGTALKQLPIKQLKDVPVPIVNLDEQKEIGALFSSIDNLIAATQSRLSSLELLKKSLLQDLFI
ncbi:restriction endonuclease subunit S [Lacticaseibacillus paracasei]|uniref:restriction endonuclease subunit S n=2 Tax=Lacticaseibacillus paracasei TaxID=1597 RepID=UPI001F5141A0|nr:restriction endonuclease subunit S [Lacticaseibacillus paracasei]MCI0374369.1 restriction endonuclease subunit S [Lacticaseibacillus paracasei]